MKHEIFNWTSEWASENHLHPLLFEEVTSTNQEAKSWLLKASPLPKFFLLKNKLKDEEEKITSGSTVI